MNFIWTDHALRRLDSLQGLVTKEECEECMRCHSDFRLGQHYLVVKQLPKSVTIHRPEYSYGDTVVAVLDVDKTVVRIPTIMLRHHKWPMRTHKEKK